MKNDINNTIQYNDTWMNKLILDNKNSNNNSDNSNSNDTKIPSKKKFRRHVVKKKDNYRTRNYGSKQRRYVAWNKDEEIYLLELLRKGDETNEIIVKFRNKYIERAKIRTDVAIQTKLRKLQDILYTEVITNIKPNVKSECKYKKWESNEINYLRDIIQKDISSKDAWIMYHKKFGHQGRSKPAFESKYLKEMKKVNKYDNYIVNDPNLEYISNGNDSEYIIETSKKKRKKNINNHKKKKRKLNK